MRRTAISAAARDEESEINLTPMLDVVFIMLIFFIVTANFIKEPGLEVNRPDSLIKFAVTIKKMSIINTTSSMGVKLISLSSSLAAALIAVLLISYLLGLVYLSLLHNPPLKVHLIQLGFSPRS
jgi:biopolymer transport protein ExbD